MGRDSGPGVARDSCICSCWLDGNRAVRLIFFVSIFFVQYSAHKKVFVSRVHREACSCVHHKQARLYGAPEYQIKKLQRVMNASARLVYRAPKYCHITPLLKELHWLPVRLRVDFKILLVTFKILHGIAPSYLKVAQNSFQHFPRCRL